MYHKFPDFLSLTLAQILLKAPRAPRAMLQVHLPPLLLLLLLLKHHHIAQLRSRKTKRPEGALQQIDS